MVVKQIRVNQAKLSRVWKGPNVEQIGRPGISNQAGQQVQPAIKKLTDYLKLEDERFRYLQEAIAKFKEIDEERQIYDATPIKQQQKNESGGIQSSATKEVQLALQIAQSNSEKKSDLINFKMPKDLQLVSTRLR